MYITTSRRDSETRTCVQHRCIRKRRRSSLSIASHPLFGFRSGDVLWRTPIPKCLTRSLDSHRYMQSCDRVLPIHGNHHIHQRPRTSIYERDSDLRYKEVALRFFFCSNAPPFHPTPATLPSSRTIPLTHNALFPPRSNWQPAILSSHKLAG